MLEGVECGGVWWEGRKCVGCTARGVGGAVPSEYFDPSHFLRIRRPKSLVEWS